MHAQRGVRPDPAFVDLAADPSRDQEDQPDGRGEKRRGDDTVDPRPGERSRGVADAFGADGRLELIRVLSGNGGPGGAEAPRILRRHDHHQMASDAKLGRSLGLAHRNGRVLNAALADDRLEPLTNAVRPILRGVRPRSRGDPDDRLAAEEYGCCRVPIRLGIGGRRLRRCRRRGRGLLGQRAGRLQQQRQCGDDRGAQTNNGDRDHIRRRLLTWSCARERASEAFTEATSSSETFSSSRAAARARASSTFASSMCSAAIAMSVITDT